MTGVSAGLIVNLVVRVVATGAFLPVLRNPV